MQKHLSGIAPWAHAIIARFWAPVVTSLVLVTLAACVEGPQLAPANKAAGGEAQGAKLVGDQPEVVIYAADLPDSALYEFDIWDDSAAAGGKLLGIPNNGDELDPPPENDPHVTLKAPVQSGIPYRCWVHMKVGAPKGKSQANMVWVQFTDAVDKTNKEVFKPETGSYLTAQGPVQEGWTWVGCGVVDDKPTASLIYFRTSGEITVRIQAGMEGVGFDQFLLSPARFLEKPPAEAIVKK